MRKICIFLCVMLLLVTSVRPAVADQPEITPDIELVHEAKDLYRQCLAAAGRGSFRGYCGLLVSHQLWKLGINKDLEIHDGNQYLSVYRNEELTSGGYMVQTYDSGQYSLSSALNTITENGYRDVRNILVVFRSTTTEAGSTYGHACVINAIRGGIVYFTESFNYVMGRMEGQTIACTIADFVKFYSDWTTFGSVIYFGQKQYSDSCTATPINTYLQLRFDSNLRSQPCLMGENNCRRIRSLAAGELLHATAIYENEYGDIFYQVTEGETVSYVSANAVFQRQPQKDRESWFQENGKWFCYENGVPLTGWVTRISVTYYLAEDGSAVTGWNEIDGQLHYFSATGALCRGWFTDQDKIFYQDAEGVPVKGLQQIGGKQYFFCEDGSLLTKGTVTLEGMTFSVNEDMIIPRT